MSDVKSAVTFVGTRCRVLLGEDVDDRSARKVLVELKSFFEELPEGGLLDVANLALVAVRVLLRASSSSSVKEACLEVMAVCFRRGSTICSLDLFEDVLKNLLLVIDPPIDPPDSVGGSLAVQRCPELVFAAAECLRAMVSVAPENVQYAGFVARVLQDTRLRISLGHSFHALLNAANSRNYPRDCRQSALLALCSCMRALGSPAVLAFFFPGIVSNLVKIACGDFKDGSKVIVAAVEAFGDVSCIVLSCNECLPILRDGPDDRASLSASAHRSDSRTPAVDGDQNVPHVQRTKEWLASTLRHYDSALSLLFSQQQQFVLSTFGFRVRMALVRCSSRILAACGAVLGQSACRLCDYLMIHLTRAVPREIHSVAWNSVLAFAASLDEAEGSAGEESSRSSPAAELFQHLTDHVLELVASFGRGFGVSDLDSVGGESVSPLSEIEKRNHILRITGYVRLFAEARKSGVWSSAASAFLRSVSDEVQEIVARLLAILDLISSTDHCDSAFRPLSDAVAAQESSAGDNVLYAARGFATAKVLKRAKFRFFTDEAVLFAVFDLCDLLGRHAGGVHVLPLLVGHVCGDSAAPSFSHSAIVLLPKILQGACGGSVEPGGSIRPGGAVGGQSSTRSDGSTASVADVGCIAGSSLERLDGRGSSCAAEVAMLHSSRPDVFTRRIPESLFSAIVDCIKVLVSPPVFGLQPPDDVEMRRLVEISDRSFAARELAQSSRKSDELRSCLVLDALGQLFGLLGPLSNDVVPFVLYPVIERFASQSAFVVETAENTLVLLSAACGFDCVPDLLLNSTDIVIDVISHRLHHFEWYPDTLRVFSSILRLSGSWTLSLVDDCLDAVLNALSFYRSAAYSYEFLRVLLEVMRLVERSGNLRSLFAADTEERDEESEEVDPSGCDAESSKAGEIDEIAAFFEDYHRSTAAGAQARAGSPGGGDTENDSDVVGAGDDMPIGGPAEKRWLQCKELAFADRIVRSSIVQLYSRSMRVRVLALEILELGVRLLVRCPTLLFPLLHTMWGAVLARISEAECPVTVKLMALIRQIAESAPSFMFARLVKGAAPKILRSIEVMASRRRAEWIVSDARPLADVASGPFFKAVCAMLDVVAVLLALRELHAEQHADLFRFAWSSCVDPFVESADSLCLPAELIGLSSRIRDIVLSKCGGLPVAANVDI